MPARGFPLAAALALALTLAASLSARPWTLTDMFGDSMGFIDDVQISPDGAWILADRIQLDLKKNTFASRYLLLPASGGSPREMPERYAHPRWAPDGRRIAWIAMSEKGEARIALTDGEGRDPRMLSSGQRPVLRFSWSPDGTWIAAVETETKPAQTKERLHWMGAGNDFLDKQPPQRELWKVDAATGKETRLTKDPWSYGGAAGDRDPSFSADGGRLAAVRQPTAVFEDFDREQYVIVDVRTGAVSPLLDHPFFAYPGSVGPQFSPSGSEVAHVRSWDGKLASRQDLFVGTRDVTASLDRDCWSCGGGGFAWQPGNLIVDLMDGVSMRLFRVDPAGGTPEPLTPAEGSVQAFALARTGRIAYAWSTPTQPPEVYVLDPGGKPRRLSHLNPIPSDLPIAPTRRVEWPDGRGHVLHGQLTLPEGEGKGAALVVELHGGPQCADDSSFDPIAQYLASHGYAFFRPDPRGSDGYGDWSYKAIVGDWGPGPMADVMAGVDAVLASGVGSPERLFVEGGSYGGYLTSWIVTHTDRFRAAVAAVPVTNMLLDYTLSEDSNIHRRFFTDKPATVPEKLAEQSPLTYAGDEHTPLLLITGLRDTRAPYPQTIEFYKVLAEYGAPVRLLADPLSGHGPGDPEGMLAWARATCAWLAGHGGPPLPDAQLPR